MEYRFLSLDAPGITGATTTQFDLFLSTTTGGLSGSLSLLDSDTPFTAVLPFSSLTGPGNLSAVTAATFVFNAGAQAGTDFTLDKLSVVGPPTPPPATVPEPSAIALMLSGLIATTAAWSRRAGGGRTA
jgi:hypothetical protein